MPVDDLQILRGLILLPRAQQAYLSNQTTLAIDLCRQTLALLPPEWTFIRGGSMLYLGMSMQASNQAQAAEQLLLDAYETYSDKTSTYALFLLQSLSFIYLNIGRLERAWQTAQILLQGATRSRIAVMKSWADYFLGMVCYHRDELESARRYFTQIFENRFSAHIATFRDAVAGLTMIHQIRGESAEAWGMVESISQFDLELKRPRRQPDTLAARPADAVARRPGWRRQLG